MNGFVGREGENAVLETEDAQHSNELIRDVVAEAIFQLDFKKLGRLKFEDKRSDGVEGGLYMGIAERKLFRSDKPQSILQQNQMPKRLALAVHCIWENCTVGPYTIDGL